MLFPVSKCALMYAQISWYDFWVYCFSNINSAIVDKIECLSSPSTNSVSAAFNMSKHFCASGLGDSSRLVSSCQKKVQTSCIKYYIMIWVAFSRQWPWILYYNIWYDLLAQFCKNTFLITWLQFFTISLSNYDIKRHKCYCKRCSFTTLAGINFLISTLCIWTSHLIFHVHCSFEAATN